MRLYGRAELYRPHLANRVPIISAQTLAEIYLWPEVRNWGERRRRELIRFLQDYAVEYPDDEICRRYAEVNAAYSEVEARSLEMSELLGVAQGRAHDALEMALSAVIEMAGRSRDVSDPLIQHSSDVHAMHVPCQLWVFDRFRLQTRCGARVYA